MGHGSVYECRKCGYRASGLEGIGFAYPEVYRKVQRDAAAGRYGKEVQRFLREHPHGQISAEYIMVVCEDCGHIESVLELSMYIPEDGYDPEKDPDYHGYLMGYEFAEHYTLVKTYRHTCRRCGGEMKRSDPDQKEFRCPVCGEVLEEKGLMWD
ncbi:MAG: hypothetical protein IJH98_06660 [Solobacterium sp.]|nr:hypothetical protein [Solobacterium sp.]